MKWLMKTNWMENLVIYDSETFTGGLIWIQESVESWLLHESHNIFFLHLSGTADATKVHVFGNPLNVFWNPR